MSGTDKLPLGGYLLIGIDPSRIFYLGGYTRNGTSDKKQVFELIENWELTEKKLPIAMTVMDTVFLDSRLNMTNCMTDQETWPKN